MGYIIDESKKWKRWYAWHSVIITEGSWSGRKVIYCYIERKGPFHLSDGTGNMIYLYRKSLSSVERDYTSPWQVIKEWLINFFQKSYKKCNTMV